ncbi:MAG: signal peptidase I [PVC group bacterium]
MSREERKLRKETRAVLKSGRWILKRRKKKLSPDRREKLSEAIGRLETAAPNGDPKEIRSNAKKLSVLLTGDLAPFRKGAFREWAESILFALLMVFIIRTVIVQPFKIPTGSMQPTLLGVKKICPACGREYRYDRKTCDDGTPLVLEHIGDKILVNKFIYGARTPDRIPYTSILLPYLQLPALRKPRRGDIVVFHYPEDVSIDYVKRLVGLPGETIEIRDGKIIADGKDVATPEMEKMYYTNGRPFEQIPYGRPGQSFVVPAKGMVINLDPGTRESWQDLVRADGHGLEVTDGSVLIDEEPRRSYALEQNHYYVLGDNSTNSRDSRYWGFVPEKYLVGEVFFKYWPPRRWGFAD